MINLKRRALRMICLERSRVRTACLVFVLFLVIFFTFNSSPSHHAGVSSLSNGVPLVFTQNSSVTFLQSSSRDEKQVQSADAHKSVLLFGYMRGGTTLLDHLMSQDDRAITWFEPLASHYGHMYVLPPFRIHTSIIYHDHPLNKTLRPLEDWEMSSIVDFFTNLFSCNLNKIPYEFLSCSFIVHTLAISDFVECYKQRTLYYDKEKKYRKVFFESECFERTGVSDYCEVPGSGRKQSVKNSLQKHCHVFMRHTRELAEMNGSPRAITPVLLVERIRSNTGLQISSAQAKAFIKYQICINGLGQVVRQCGELTQMEEHCKRRIRIAKVLRIKMNNMEALIQAVADMSVVHYVRDPRAIAKSRVTLNDQKLNANVWEQTSRELCNEMLEDILAGERLNNTYPGVIHRLKYEDIVLTPEQGLEELYQSFSESYPPHVLKWLLETMNAKKDGGSFSVERANASDHVDSWRYSLPPESIKNVNNHPACQQVFALLRYSP